MAGEQAQAAPASEQTQAVTPAATQAVAPQPTIATVTTPQAGAEQPATQGAEPAQAADDVSKLPKWAQDEIASLRSENARNRIAAKKAKDEKDAADAEAAEAERKRKEAEMTETQKLEARLKEQETLRLEKETQVNKLLLQKAFDDAAEQVLRDLKLVFKNPQAHLDARDRLVDFSSVTLNGEKAEGMADVIKAMTQSHDYLFVSSNGQRQAPPDNDGGKRGTQTEKPRFATKEDKVAFAGRLGLKPETVPD